MGRLRNDPATAPVRREMAYFCNRTSGASHRRLDDIPLESRHGPPLLVPFRLERPSAPGGRPVRLCRIQRLTALVDGDDVADAAFGARHRVDVLSGVDERDELILHLSKFAQSGAHRSELVV